MITAATSMQCRTRRVDDENALILIPLGILARTRSLARRLLWHLADRKAPTINFLGSTLDVRDFPWELAPDLVPVFGDDAAEEDGDDAYWAALADFDHRTPGNRKRDALTNEIMGYCFLNLALHELVHITARHDRLLKLMQAGDPRIPSHLDLTTLRRGMEVDADGVAAHYFTTLHIRHERTAKAVRKRPTPFFGWASFATTMLFGLYDTHRKTVYEYDDGIYPHPLIRYEIWNEAMLNAAGGDRPGLAEKAQQASQSGWLECISAFNRLEWDCMRGVYGRPEPSVEGGTGRYLPVTTLKYGAASVLAARMRADQRLADEIHRLVIKLFRPEP